MKKEIQLSTSVIIAVSVVIILGLVFLLPDSGNEAAKKEPTKTVIKQDLKPVESIEKKQNDYYIPENYAIDFYNGINKKDWSKLSEISNNFTAKKLKETFDFFDIKGFKILSVQKNSKTVSNIIGIVSYTNVTNELKTKDVSIRMELANDYKTWLISPLTVY